MKHASPGHAMVYKLARNTTEPSHFCLVCASYSRHIYLTVLSRGMSRFVVFSALTLLCLSVFTAPIGVVASPWSPQGDVCKQIAASISPASEVFYPSEFYNFYYSITCLPKLTSATCRKTVPPTTMIIITTPPPVRSLVSVP